MEEFLNALNDCTSMDELRKLSIEFRENHCIALMFGKLTLLLEEGVCTETEFWTVNELLKKQLRPMVVLGTRLDELYERYPEHPVWVSIGKHLPCAR